MHTVTSYFYVLCCDIEAAVAQITQGGLNLSLEGAIHSKSDAALLHHNAHTEGSAVGLLD